MSDAARPEPESPAPKHDPGTSAFWWIPGGMLLTAGAAILLWWLWPPNEAVRSLNDESGSASTSVEPLPTYVLETDGGLEHLDSAGEAPEQSSHHRYRRDTKFEWILRPKADEPGEIAVRAFAFADGGSVGLPLLALDELVRIAASGTVEIAGTVEQLDLELGRYTIALAVGRPAKLPTRAADVHEPAANAGWQLRRIEIEIGE